MVASASGFEPAVAIVVAVGLSASGVIHAARRMRGTGASNLWQVDIAAAGFLAAGGLLFFALLLFGFAGYCDNCASGVSKVPGIVASIGTGAAALAVAAAAVWAWRAVERGRTGLAEGGVRATLVLPALAAWAMVGVASLPTDVLLNHPEPEADALMVARERCVAVAPDIPCRAASQLRSASNDGVVFAAWRNARAVRGAVIRGRRAVSFGVGRVEPAPLEDGEALAVAAAPEGSGFAAAWTDGLEIHVARVGPTGDVASRSSYPRRYWLDQDVLLALAPTSGGFLLFSFTDSDLEEYGESRLRALPLTADLEPRSGWRFVTTVESDYFTAATGLPDGTVAVTVGDDAARGQASIVVDAAGNHLRTVDEHRVVPGAGGGRLIQAPHASSDGPGVSRAGGLEDVVLDGRNRIWFLWRGTAPGLGRDERLTGQQWLTGPGLPDDGRLAATGLEEAQLAATDTAAQVLGIRKTGRGAGAGDEEIVVVNAP
jgi:hypothetical protein